MVFELQAVNEFGTLHVVHIAVNKIFLANFFEPPPPQFPQLYRTYWYYHSLYFHQPMHYIFV